MTDLAEIAEYLTGGSGSTLQQQQQQLSLGLLAPALHQQQCLTEVSGTVAESTNYVPGWEDIFNINQKQLEAAIRRVSNDPNLEPQRKAYLIQNIMVSRYIVAQQRRMQTSGSVGGAAAAAGDAAAGGAPTSAGQMLPPPTQQQHQHVHAHAHVHAAGGCCHHDAHADGQQQQLHAHAHAHHAQHQQSSSSSNAPAAAGPAALAQQQQQQQQQPVRTYADAAAGVLGCKHYRRSAQLVAPCCGKVFTCRWIEQETCCCFCGSHVSPANARLQPSSETVRHGLCAQHSLWLRHLLSHGLRNWKCIAAVRVSVRVAAGWCTEVHVAHL
jgi:zinc finger-like protein